MFCYLGPTLRYLGPKLTAYLGPSIRLKLRKLLILGPKYYFPRILSKFAPPKRLKGGRSGFSHVHLYIQLTRCIIERLRLTKVVARVAVMKLMQLACCSLIVRLGKSTSTSADKKLTRYRTRN